MGSIGFFQSLSSFGIIPFAYFTISFTAATPAGTLNWHFTDGGITNGPNVFMLLGERAK